MDRFLASVERANIETEARLVEKLVSPTPKTVEEREKVNLRRGKNVSNRWKSMDSLDRKEHQGRREERRPRSRDSFGPRGFTSMGNLVSESRQIPTKKSPSNSCSEIETVPEGKKTKVEYLGSLPIDSKAADLTSLQIPLKNLYLKFIEMSALGEEQLPGTLEISETGLKVNHIRELHKGVQEIFNPFPTIAVWAAVKFVHKKEQNQHKFAFLPLIADSDDSDKIDLFNSMTVKEAKLATTPKNHPGEAPEIKVGHLIISFLSAMFAAVMRKAGVPKQLECHGFICDSADEAILVAANLYQALLETMKRNKKQSASSLVSFVRWNGVT